MRIVHYKSAAVKLVVHARLAKSDGLLNFVDFHEVDTGRRNRLFVVFDRQDS
jgi:hypothetical protein